MTQTRGAAYYWANKERLQADNARRRLQRKRELIDAYGGVCACCGEHRLAFLTVDHIEGGGNRHRQSLGNGKVSGSTFLLWLRREGYPPGFQALCFNCNAGRHINGGVCPHVTDP